MAMAPDPPGVAPTLIGSVQHALRLLEAVGAHHGGAPAKQLARETGLPLATAYHLLRTLVHEGYLRRQQGVFVLGEAAHRLAAGGAVQNRPGTDRRPDQPPRPLPPPAADGAARLGPPSGHGTERTG